MIVSETLKRVTSRWLQACVLLCATVVLPCGMVYAQDYDAVGKRLKAAVEAGELTGGQARVMLGALKNADGDKKDQGSDRAKAYLANVKKELVAAVEAGKISKEDAIKRYQGAEKAIKARMARARGKRSITVEEYKGAEAKMRKMVERAKDKVDWESIKKRIEGAVKRGDMTREQADAKYKAIKERLGRKKKDDVKGIDWESIKKRIEGAVERGDITRKQADAKYKAIKERK
jgi:predicted RNA-binding protein associated with RNAse of E/G family